MKKSPKSSGKFSFGLGMGRLSGFVLGLLLALALVTGTGLWVAYRFLDSEFPEVASLKSHYPWVYYQGPKNPPVIKLKKGQPGDWVSINEISPLAVGAIVVSEDWAFFQHKGYDANQIKEAIKEDLAVGGFARGASTITQQVVKNVFLSQEKSLWRKAKELILAIRLEKSVGKKRILETYLNIAEWGQGIYGIKEASQFYFQKPPSALTAKEGAFLAMLLPSPRRYSQSFRQKALTGYARSTVRSILSKMTQAHYLDEEQLQREVQQPLLFEANQNLDLQPDTGQVPDELAPEAMPEDVPPAGQEMPPPHEQISPQSEIHDSPESI